MTFEAEPAPRLTQGLLATGTLFVLAACLGYHLGGTPPPTLHPLRPGGPELRVEIAPGPAREVALSINGNFTLSALRSLPSPGESRPAHFHDRGTILVRAELRNLRVLRPGGPADGEAFPDRLRIRGATLRYPGRREPIWGAVEVERTGPETLEAVVVVDLETYLQGVLLPEMGARFPLEALKAQAVAARSYALARRLDTRRAERDRVLRRSDLDQVYRPEEPVPEAIRIAVDATRGEVLGTLASPIPAYYHSTCGGATRDAAPHFDPTSPIRGAPCPYCRASRYFRWERRYPLDGLIRALAPAARIAPPITAFQIEPDTSGRAVTVRVTHAGGVARIGGDAFRSLINRHLATSREEQLLSTRLDALELDPSQPLVQVRGRGWGHGVGMCQMGAAGMAREGHDYRRILAHYYAGLPVNRLWGDLP
ncbi:MAG: SpoIID/LytB domain-containing protein [Planctomycetes bacterium]|nr:SpoIID/LytB domain-containing protein [Planctomycetota bacterium]